MTTEPLTVTDALSKVAELVGFGLDNNAWYAEPVELDALCPGLPLVLFRLFSLTAGQIDRVPS